MERFFTPEQQPESTVGTTEALFTLGNSIGQKAYNPQFRVSNDEDTNFDLATYMKDVPEENRMTVLDARNESYANNLLAREAQEQEAIRTVDTLPWYGKYPGLLATGVADPINLLPIAGALGKTTAMWRTYDRLDNVVKAGLVGAATGAVSNVAAEGVMGAQGLETDYMSAAAFGAILGGGIGGVTGLFGTPNTAPINAIAGESKNNYFNQLEVDNNVKSTTEFSPGSTPMFKSGVPKAPDGGLLFPKFLKSDAQLMAEHADETVRDFGFRIASPTNAAKDVDGNPIAIKDTAMDRVTQWAGDKQSLDVEVTQLYTEARKGGYKGNMESFQTEVSIAYRRAASEQERAVYDLVETEFAPIAKQLDVEYKSKKAELEGDSKGYLNKIPGASGEGVGKVRKSKYTAGTTKTIEEEIPGTGGTKTGIPELDELLDAPQTREVIVDLTPEEIAKDQGILDKEKVAFTESLQKEGIKDPVIVDYKDGKLVLNEGNQRLSAANELGIDVPIKYTSKVPDNLKFKKNKVDTEALREEYKQKASDEKAKLSSTAYDNTPIAFNGSHANVLKGAESYKTYYGKHLDRMQKLGMEGVEGINLNRLYMPRVYNNERIRSMDKADIATTVREAVKAHPANRELLKNAKELEKVVNDLTNTLKNLSSKEYFLDYSYIAPKELPLQTHLKQIKVKLDDATMGNLLLQDAQNLAGLYSYKMTRQQAIQYKFGTTNLDDIREQYIKPVEQSLIDTKGDMTIVQNMETAMKDLIGTLRMAPDGNSLSHTFSRVTGSYDSMTMGGTFGFNTIAEFPIAMWTTGFRNIVNSQYGKSVGAVNDLLFKETKAKNWEFANELIALGHMSEALRTSNAQRMTDMDAHFSARSFEKGLQKGTETLFKYNGLRGSTSALEAIVSSNAITDIPRLSKALLSGSISRSDANRLARWGLDEENVHTLSKTITDSATFKNGKLQELGLEKWPQAQVDDLAVMVNRVISESVIQVDTVHLPTWLKLPKPMTKLLTRFLRYPAAAHGILLQRGVTDDKAGLAASIAGGVMTFAMFKYLQEQAQVAVGDKKKSEAKFDIVNDKDAWSRLIIKAMNYSGGMGMMTVGIDHSMTLLGQEQLGTEYRQGGLSLLGPTAGRLEDIQTLGRALGEGEWTGTKDYNALKSFVPGATAPIVSELLNATAEEWGIKR